MQPEDILTSLGETAAVFAGFSGSVDALDGQKPGVQAKRSYRRAPHSSEEIALAV